MAEASLGIPERRTAAELIEAIAEDELRQGRSMTPRERNGFALGFFSPSYEVDCFTDGLARCSAQVVGQGLPIKDDGEGEL